jgi:hypothetical protein
MNKTPSMNNEPGVDRECAPPAGIESLRAPRAPQRDLWPGIEARIQAQIAQGERRRAWQQPVWLAAAAGFAAVTVFTTAVLTQHPRQSLTTTVASLQAPPEVVAATRSSQNSALVPVVTHQIHPETRALMKANLKLVNSAEVQVRKAMQSDPDAAYLQSLLATAHQQKQQLQVALEDQEDGP